MAWILSLLLAACASEVVLSTATETCTDYDFDDPEESTVVAEQAGANWLVGRTNVIMGCDDLFAPDVDASGKDIIVYELWDERTEDDCTTCLEPTLVVQSPPAGVYYVEWHDGDSGTVLGSVEFTVN